jgi:hypothetical protein
VSTTPSRLSRIEEQIWPFLRSPKDTGCELYWVGVPAFPAPATHRAWLIDFFIRFTAELEKQFQIRGEFFLQYKTIMDIEKRFRQLSFDINPWPGLTRKPGASIPSLPTKEELQAAMQGAPFDIKKYFPDSCFWLRAPLPKLLPDFFGLGGGSMFYLKADPNTKPPQIPHLDELKKTFPQAKFDKLEEMVKSTASLKEKFLPESKKLFGEGLEEEPNYRGITFILPLLETSDFFSRPEEEKKKWFELFDVFWRESPVDKGIYIASKLPIQDTLCQLIESMKEEGKRYPER